MNEFLQRVFLPFLVPPQAIGSLVKELAALQR
jgi:hypothetical protein